MRNGQRMREFVALQLVNFALLFLLLIILIYRIWIEILIIVVVLTLILTIRLVFFKSSTVRNWMINLALSQKRLHKLKVYIMQTKINILSNATINHSRFYPISINEQQFLVNILKIIHQTEEFLVQLPPYFRQLIEYCGSHDFDFDSIQLVFGYFKKSPMQLAQEQLEGKELKKYEIDRLIYEASSQERQLLENVLPMSHPLISQIEKQQEIMLHPEFFLLK